MRRREEQDCWSLLLSSWSLLRSVRARQHSYLWWLARAAVRHSAEQKTTAEQVGQWRGERGELARHSRQLLELRAGLSTPTAAVSTARISPGEILSLARRWRPCSGEETTLSLLERAG